MDESKLLEFLNERLDRMEGKLDQHLEKGQAQEVRLTKLESQAGFVRASLAVLGSLLLATLSWLLDRLTK